MQKILMYFALTTKIMLLVLLTSWGVAAAARAGILITAALPFALALLMVIRLLGPGPERVSWAVFTVWLGSTYLQAGSAVEYALFAVYIGLALLSVFKSPYFLAAAWLFHPIWDFVPRELPEVLEDLPMACVLFDIPIGLYLLWGSHFQRGASLQQLPNET